MPNRRRFFSRCGTESDNIALIGGMRSSSRKGIVTTPIEHSAILKTAEALKKDGYSVNYTSVDKESRTTIESLEAIVDGTTGIVSVMHANNETGVIQDISGAAMIAHRSGALFHTDAVQSAGKIPIDVKAYGIDMLSLSGHKMNASKGVGVLYIRKGIQISSITFGGGHEKGMRPGTENVAGIAGLAKAFELAVTEMKDKKERLEKMREALENGLVERIPGIYVNGKNADRLPGTSNISIPGVDGEALLFSLDKEGVAVSTGSACSSGEVAPSHVLLAMGIEPRVCQSSLRFSMGWGTDMEGIEHIIKVLPPVVERLRRISGGV